MITALKPFDPDGIEFFDAASERTMKLSTQIGHWTHGWILFKHPDGQWVTLRRATAEDLAALGRSEA